MNCYHERRLSAALDLLESCQKLLNEPEVAAAVAQSSPAVRHDAFALKAKLAELLR